MTILRYALKQALVNGDLIYKKQPIVPLNREVIDSKNIVQHYEVLTGVSTLLAADYRLESIDELINELELYRGTVYLDELTLRTTIKWISRERELYPDINSLYHVNIHPDTVNNNKGSVLDTMKILERISTALDSAYVRHDQICFEITENTLLKNPEMIADMIRGIREMGCTVALDDFGKKMLNLSTLKVLRPDYLKIDGMYVRGALDDAFDRQVIKSLVELSKIIGSKTIAEHVETKEECEIMRDLGVDYGQGWFFSKSVDLDESVSSDVFYPCSYVLSSDSNGAIE